MIKIQKGPVVSKGIWEKSIRDGDEAKVCIAQRRLRGGARPDADAGNGDQRTDQVRGKWKRSWTRVEMPHQFELP